MITGYKKKKLGHPSEKLSGDAPRATWKTVVFSEIIWPVCLAALFIIAYMFVKSFPDRDGNQPPSPLVRIAVVSIGPIVWNATVLLAFFMISLFLGPMMSSWAKFGSVIAAIAHLFALVGIIGFFEFFVRTLRVGIDAIYLSLYFSGSSSFGTHRMQCWVSLRSLPSKGPFRKSS
jgi:1,3-beta-glucan synthase